MTDEPKRAPFSGPEWTDAPVLEQVGADDRVRYFYVYGPSGELQGALYLNLVNHHLGYLEKIRGSAAKWGQVVGATIRFSDGDGRRAFEEWSDPAKTTGETYSVGPVKEASNVNELGVLVRDA